MSTITPLVGTDGITTGNSMTKINANFENLNTDKEEASNKSTDTTFAANSDALYPSQAAVKAYVDAGGNVNASTTAKGIVEEATQAEVNAGTATGATGARLFVNPSALPSLDVQEFTATGAGTWTKPSRGKIALVQVWGAGGSGGRELSQTGGSGGGGGYVEATFDLSDLGATETATVGAGGASKTGSDLSGDTGGNSTFGSFLTAYGGGGGSANSSGGGGGGGFWSAGLVSTSGGAGGGPSGGAGGGAGAGGESIYGGGGGGGTTNTTSVGGRSIHGGGGGGGSVSDGGNSFYGGGGGGLTPGTSVYGGAGGAQGVGAGSTGAAGQQPGGGGGSGSSTSGAGGNGKIVVTVF